MQLPPIPSQPPPSPATAHPLIPSQPRMYETPRCKSLVQVTGSPSRKDCERIMMSDLCNFPPFPHNRLPRDRSPAYTFTTTDVRDTAMQVPCSSNRIAQ
ncbi:hypothetical protein J6590_006448 [Homalodisca vitripennis]|nr:hypothetical protein J6590_006448 [Homalodisca vitripennis]